MLEKNNSEGSNEIKKLFTFRKYSKRLKIFFIYWLIIAIVICLFNAGFVFTKKIFTGNVTSIVNFSFDGIEMGMDPNGNKFDVNDMKSEEIVEEAIAELKLEDIKPEQVCSNISIDGVIPSNVISRITQYSSLFGSNQIAMSKKILDTSYYPTQYKISLECSKAGLDKKSAAMLLNKITEKYNNVFYSSYGYNTSLESAVTSIDYRDYDYVDAVDVFTSSLKSLKKYIDELSKNDTTRFRSDKGYTFADISASIDTVCNEDLDLISSYIMVNNVTKDRKTLIANYEFKIKDLKREKKAAEERIASLSNTIDTYEKDSVIIFGNSSENPNSTITNTSETYNNLISDKIAAQTVISTCEQKMNLYNKRINSLRNATSTIEDSKRVENEFERISEKINTLITTINETATEYYADVVLDNSYKILSPADSSILTMLKDSAAESLNMTVSYELILAAVYLAVSVVFCFVRMPDRFLKRRSKNKRSRKNK